MHLLNVFTSWLHSRCISTISALQHRPTTAWPRRWHTCLSELHHSPAFLSRGCCSNQRAHSSYWSSLGWQKSLLSGPITLSNIAQSMHRCSSLSCKECATRLHYDRGQSNPQKWMDGLMVDHSFTMSAVSAWLRKVGAHLGHDHGKEAQVAAI